MHDRVIFAGDLNYRIANVSRDEAEVMLECGGFAP